MSRIGSLCTGYGGLDMAVENVLGGEVVWYSEFDKHPATLLAERFPCSPNLGDMTKIDWAEVPSVDILTGGYPCQPFSQAGKKLGEDDPRHLWPFIREAIRLLRPRLTVLENVRGHRARGFATVLRDCAEDGLAVRWISVRASDAGAPHQRERVFFVIADPDSERLKERGLPRPVAAQVPGDLPGLGPLPKLLPTPAAADGGRGPDFARATRPGSGGDDLVTTVARAARQVGSPRWGDYREAISWWELLTRPAPAPTGLNSAGNAQLSVEFVEWMMGLPRGWVADVDIPYRAKIKVLGNGVVPQQAELALRLLIPA